ncbi:HlyD family secretion protein [Terrarubrum flagellatum]|uniref:HlyD family secretion protein n=1 Tax=Terrirubrum flagellatum TaxID=2895980 RepID=UPI0031450B25
MNGMRRTVVIVLEICAALSATAVCAAALLPARRQAQPPIAGMVRRTEIRIAPEVGGRLARIEVAPGQTVTKGALLASIDNPDLIAALVEAEAALAAARAERDRLYAGPRAEEVEIAAHAVRSAEANLALARQQNARVAALSARGFNSGVQLDESSASLAKAAADLDLKRAQWKAAKDGPIAEERALADARVLQADAAVADARVKLGKTALIAPENGAVGTLIAEPGEVLSPGKPALLFAPDRGLWFAFTMREDQLGGIRVGATTQLTVGDARPFPAVVTELRPLGEFATWRAKRAVGDHDLNGFRVRFEGSPEHVAIEPGQTVFLHAVSQK